MLLGLAYRPGDEAPEDGDDDTDWLVLTHPDGRRALAVQEVEQLTASRWPEPGHPSVSHLDTTVPSRSALDAVHDLVLELGGELRLTAPTTRRSRCGPTPARRGTSSACSSPEAGRAGDPDAGSGQPEPACLLPEVVADPRVRGVLDQVARPARARCGPTSRRCPAR